MNRYLKNILKLIIKSSDILTKRVLIEELVQINNANRIEIIEHYTDGSCAVKIHQYFKELKWKKL